MRARRELVQLFEQIEKQNRGEFGAPELWQAVVDTENAIYTLAREREHAAEDMAREQLDPPGDVDWPDSNP